MKRKRKAAILLILSIVALIVLWLATAHYGIPVTRIKHMNGNNFTSVTNALDITHTNVASNTLQTYRGFIAGRLR